MNLIPLTGRLVVKRQEVKETASGIVLPDRAQDKRPRRGEVLAVGLARMRDSGVRDPQEIKLGDVVYFAQFSGVEIEDGPDKYLILDQADVLAVVGK